MIGLHPSRVVAVVFRFPFSESISCLFQKWEREYYLDRCIETFRERWCDTPPSAAYTYTITTHPSETHHPLWKEASKTKVEEDELGRKITLPLYRRRTTSAAFQLAVDHAFMGTYAKHFRPSDPPESLLCTCGSVLRSPSHIIIACPLHYQHRVNSGIHSFNGTLPLRTLFSAREGTPKLLSFLQGSRAAFRPLDLGPINLARRESDDGSQVRSKNLNNGLITVPSTYIHPSITETVVIIYILCRAVFSLQARGPLHTILSLKCGSTLYRDRSGPQVC